MPGPRGRPLIVLLHHCHQAPNPWYGYVLIFSGSSPSSLPPQSSYFLSNKLHWNHAKKHFQNYWQNNGIPLTCSQCRHAKLVTFSNQSFHTITQCFSLSIFSDVTRLKFKFFKKNFPLFATFNWNLQQTIQKTTCWVFYSFQI